MSQLLGSISAAVIDKAMRDELYKRKRFDIFKKQIASLDASLTNASMGKISFYDPQGSLVAFANKQILGSWDSKTHEWQWAWSMPKLDPALKHSAKRLFFIGSSNKWAIFVTPKFKASPRLMHVLCSLSLQHVGGWHITAYKKGSKYWYVLIKNMNYLDPMMRLSLEQQMQLAKRSSLGPVNAARKAAKRKAKRKVKRKAKRKVVKRKSKRKVVKRKVKRKGKRKVKRR